MYFRALIQLFLIVFFAVFAFKLDSPISVEPKDYSKFSAERAYQDIEKLADKVHFIGSAENKLKKDYITQRFEDLGYETSVYKGDSHIQWGRLYRQAKTENILGRKRGTEGKKIVLVLAHYDSVTNSPGAADDVHAVACMLDVAGLIKEKSFKNDILFLVTDGEETGLHGARAYAENFNLDSIGVVLNFEARGNSGPSYAFEWSDNNGWLIDAFKDHTTKPVANSLSYEVYNRMPNGSDFTEFKERGVPGINHAFIDGFAYYHSPIDLPENLNLESVQHSGDYMYNLVNYFGNADLETENTGNASFFNLYYFLIVYPSWMDIILLVITMIILLWVSRSWFKDEKVSFRGLLFSFISSLLLILIIAALGYGLLALIKVMYPHYWNFYAGQFYNHKWYLLAVSGLAFLSHAFGGRWIFRKWGDRTYSASMFMLWMVLTIAMYAVAPSATYLLLIPLFFCAAYYLLFNYYPKISKWAMIIPIAIGLGIWVPAIHTWFLAFSLDGLVGPAVLVAIFLTFLMPFTQDLWGAKKFPHIIGGVLLFGSLIMGDLTSEPTADNPLPSNLNYFFDQNDSLAYWITSNSLLNEGNTGVIEEGMFTDVSIPWEVSRMAHQVNMDFHIPIELKTQSYRGQKTSFSLINKGLIFYLYVKDMEGISKIDFNNKKIYDIEDREMSEFTAGFYGYVGDSLGFEIEKQTEITKEIILTTFSQGIPRKDITPDNIMRTGGSSITTLRIGM